MPFPRRHRSARRGRRQGMGLRRHDRARSLESQQSHARGAAIRDLAAGAERGGARSGACHVRGDRCPRRRPGVEHLMATELAEIEALGKSAFRRGDLEAARTHYDRLVQADGSDPQQWINLAVVCQGLRDEPGEEAAIKGALARDPLDLLALILSANLLERQGKRHEAARAYGAVATVSPPLDRLNPDLRPAGLHAMQVRDRYQLQVAEFLEAAPGPPHSGPPRRDPKRFSD